MELEIRERGLVTYTKPHNDAKRGQSSHQGLIRPPPL